MDSRFFFPQYQAQPPKSWLSRVTLGQRWVVIVGVFVLILAIFVLVAYEASQTLPYFDAQAGQYLQIRLTPTVLAHPEALENALGYAFSLDQGQSTALLTTILTAQPNTLIVRSSLNGPVFIALGVQQPESLHALAADDKRVWDVSEQILAQSTTEIITTRDKQWTTASIFSAWWPKVRLALLDRALHPDLLAFTKYDGISFYGVGQAADDHLFMQLSLSGRAQAFAAPTIVTNPADALRMSTGAALTSAPSQVQSLIPLDITADPFHVWLGQPAQITLTQGTWDAFRQNPYADGLAWSVRLPASATQANTMLDALLADFSRRFPMATPRELPDKSEIFELHRDAQAFLGPNSVLDVTQQASGVFTFPHDQVHYTYADTMLTLQKGATPQPSDMRQECTVSNPMIDVHGGAQAFGQSLWKNIDFALSSQNISLCVWW